MCGGKTERAVRKAMGRRELYKKHKPFRLVFFKPAYDKRTSGLHSRVGGMSIDATVLPGDPTEVVKTLRSLRGKRLVVVIDEVQFLGLSDERIDLTDEEHDLMHQAMLDLAQSGAPLFVAGLESDFARRIPPVIRRLLLDPRVDVRRVKAICNKCGRAARLSQRYTNGRPSSIKEPMFVVQSASDPNTGMKAGDAKETVYRFWPSCELCHRVGR